MSVAAALNFTHLNPIRALFVSAVINGVVTGITTAFMAPAAIGMFLTS